MDPRLFNSHRTHPGNHVSRRQVTVTDDQPVVSTIPKIGMGLNIVRHFDLDRRLKHPPRTFAQ
jgi:hypothetical protein